MAVGLAGPLAARNQPPVAEHLGAAHPAADPLDLDAWGLSAEVPAPRSTAEGGTVEMFLAVEDGDGVKALLGRAGAVESDAASIAAVVAERLPRGISQGTELAVLFGRKVEGGKWRVERVDLADSWGTSLQITRSSAGRFAARPVASAKNLQRIRGTTGSGLYWSVRAAGVSAEAAAEYVDAIGGQLRGAAVGGRDRFDLVMAGDRLVYAGLERDRGEALQLLKWPAGERTLWVDPNAQQPRSGGMVRPVAGRLSSSFGHRVHPILRFARFHRGVDFQAASGTPIYAVADGIVIAAGWNGGYGRQVRIAHPGALQTSYSHMSSITAPVGGRIRQGEVIGHVGSSGFSTGPHLHYEMIADGRAIDPLSAPHSAMNGLSPSELARLRLRHRQLVSLAPRGGRPA